MRIAVLAAAAALIVGGVVIGTALAQQTPTPSAGSPTAGQSGPRALLERVAAKLGVPPDRVQQAFREAREELAAERGLRPGGERRGEMRQQFRGMLRQGLEIVANELRIPVDQLRVELRGSSLSEVSRRHGVEPQRVAAALTTAAQQRVDAAAAQGRLTPDQATRLKERLGESIQRMMDRQLPARLSRSL